MKRGWLFLHHLHPQSSAQITTQHHDQFILHINLLNVKDDEVGKETLAY